MWSLTNVKSNTSIHNKNVVFEKIDTFEQVVDSSLPAMELIEIEEDESRKSSVASTQVIQSIFASCDSKSFYFCKHTKIHKDAVELEFKKKQ